MKILVEMSYLKEDEFINLSNHFKTIEFTKDLLASEIDGILSMPGFLKKDNLDRYQQLKFVMVLTAGFDTLDINYFKERNIVLTNAKDVFSIQIAEDVFSKILYMNRNIAFYQEQMQVGLWNHHPVHHEISESTVGIIGTGSIGLEIAKRMKAFGVHVIGYKKTKVKLPYFDAIYTDYLGFEKVLKESDYIIIALPLSQETVHLIDENAFSLMKKTALLINIARGDIIDQEALINALKTNQIRGACLDVMTPEPLPPNHDLWKLKNVLITPHNAGSSPHVRKRLMIAILNTINNYVHHQELNNRVV
jgi:phosphoglycerate dehydrogenase-like enzyme